jgi:hypothetical protein
MSLTKRSLHGPVSGVEVEYKSLLNYLGDGKDIVKFLRFPQEGTPISQKSHMGFTI